MIDSLPRAVLRLPTLASVAAGALFVAVVAYWAWAFHTPAPHASSPRPPAPPLSVALGATLFGSRPAQGGGDGVQLLGILAFDPQHAAAIVSVGGEPARAVRLNGSVADATTLTEVRAHSIVVERNGVKREIALPAAQDPSAFIR